MGLYHEAFPGKKTTPDRRWRVEASGSPQPLRHRSTKTTQDPVWFAPGARPDPHSPQKVQDQPGLGRNVPTRRAPRPVMGGSARRGGLGRHEHSCRPPRAAPLPEKTSLEAVGACHLNTLWIPLWTAGPGPLGRGADLGTHSLQWGYRGQL